MINAELLEKTLQHVKDNQALWDQEHWTSTTECGTAYCFGGWALHLSNIKVRLADGGVAYVAAEDVPAELGLASPWTKRPGQFPVGLVAGTVLGLEPLQYNELFHGENTLDDLEEQVTALLSAAMTEQISEFLQGEAEPQADPEPEPEDQAGQPEGEKVPF